MNHNRLRRPNRNLSPHQFTLGRKSQTPWSTKLLRWPMTETFMLFRSQKRISRKQRFRPNLKNISELYPNTWRKLGKATTLIILIAPRNGMVQCTYCQEYGHTRAYCSLRTVCVACGDFHSSSNCPANKEDPKKKKCVNYQGNHTANYSGCPI